MVDLWDWPASSASPVAPGQRETLSQKSRWTALEEQHWEFISYSTCTYICTHTLVQTLYHRYTCTDIDTHTDA